MASKEFLTISIIMFTEVIGWTLILPFLPYYAEEFGASPLIVGLILSTFSIFQFISAPIIGKLSDRYGRKPLLIISQVSTMTGFLMLGFANSLLMIFLSRLVDGLFGSNMTLTRAYLTDLSKGRKRRKQISYFGAIFGFGFFIGPAVGGLLAAINYAVPSLVAAGVSLVTIVLTILFLKETVVVKKKVKITKEDFIPVKDFIYGLKIKSLKRYFTVFSLFSLSFVLVTSSLALFVKHQLGVGPENVGLIMMVIGLVRILFQLLILPRLIDREDIMQLVDAGLLMSAIGMLLVFFVDSMWLLYLIGVLFSVGSGLTRPMIIAEVSELVKKRERGRIMGVIDSIGSIAQITGPLIGGMIINYLYPGYLGIIGGSLMLVALLVELLYKRTEERFI
ncbi:MFS transporter [archaeon]|nr:MFS transporter [archaeon]